ncbi:glycosyltransferase family 2 protein [Actinopolymorpha alba]|uniref:glycosyltransferase family 2 protein n=1 Tax=Actinopolymorpha alba TaxID=533267 RepID=UPI001ED9A16C|nr:glycosyltransferase [Actinopolymorpha alba]
MSAANAAQLRLACVFLTMGDRPEELARAIRSVQDQAGDPVEIVVVANGVAAPKVPDDVRVLELPENVGIPAGRNAGLEAAHADIIMFLDDDGWLPSLTTAQRLRELFASDPRLGIVSFRITDPASGITQRRHVPRVRVGDPRESSEVTTFLGGATAIRRYVFDDVGVFPAAFFYAHEETDLAWRAMDAGWRIWYDADCVLCHPATSPTRHPRYFRLNARNRVWLAKRNLPRPVAAVYLLTWVVLTVARTRSLSGLTAWWAGLLEGLGTPCGRRKPIAWRTVWRMTRLGRPPLV